MALELYFFGEMALRAGDRALPLPGTRKAQSLLAYLVMQRPAALPREQLGARFWPESPRERGLASVSTALWHIRRVLPAPGYLCADMQTVRFDPGKPYRLDVACFETDARAGLRCRQARDPAGAARALEAALAHYRGPFLRGYYDEWCVEERQRLELRLVAVLDALLALHQATGEWEAAIHYAERILQLDPLREATHRRLMQIHGEQHRRLEVLRQYVRCREALQAELGVEPAPETRRLCLELAGDMPASATSPAAGVEPAEAVPPPLLTLPLVGRSGEIARLDTLWAGARGGSGHLVLVEGEAGIGKTRLLETFAARVRARGGHVAGSAAYCYETPQPYRALLDALRQTLAWVSPARLRTLPRWTQAELARLLPEVAAPPVAPTSGEDQAHSLDALARLLRLGCRDEPLLLILDDGQWASPATVTFFQYLATHLAEMPLLLLLAVRSEPGAAREALADLARRLGRQDRGTRLPLARLSAVETTRLLQALFGREAAVVPLARRLQRQTAGNPFFLREMIRMLCEQGDLCRQEGQWQGEWERLGSEGALGTPATVAGLIEARVGRLSPDARTLLQVAAVAGQEIELSLLQPVLGLGEGAFLDALEEVAGQGLIREEAGEGGADYRFDHPLIRGVVVAGLQQPRRRRYHRQLAAVLAGRPGAAGTPALAARLATHYRQAEMRPEAMRWLVRAGEAAAAAHAPVEADAFFSRALALRAAVADERLAARALMGAALARQQVWAGDEEVWQMLEEARALWTGLGEGAQVARCAYALAYRHAGFARARDVVRQGIDAVRQARGERALLARGYGLLARFYEHEGDVAAATCWARRQHTLAGQVGEHPLLAQAHHRLGSLLLRSGGPMSAALAHEEEAARLAEADGWLDFAAGSHNLAGFCLLQLGRTPDAAAACRRALALARERQIPWRQCWANHYLFEIALVRGRLEEATHLLDRAEATTHPSSDRFQEIVLLRARRRLALRTEGPAESAPLLAEALALSERFYPRYRPRLLLDRIALNLERGTARKAEGELRRDLAAATALARELRQRHLLVEGARLEGELAAGSGDLAAAGQAFAAAIRWAILLEQRLEEGRLRFAWGRTLVTRYPERARQLLGEAHAILAGAEARADVAEIERLLRQIAF